jgi:hypothetical protein
VLTIAKAAKTNFLTPSAFRLPSSTNVFKAFLTKALSRWYQAPA